VPSGADLIILKSVIHDWDDERATTILTACRSASTVESRLLLVECVMPECMTSSAAHQRAAALDIRMLTLTGGSERTEAHYRKLLERAGFGLTRTIELGPPSGQAILEALPR
jgi:hypothetical protein